jgi:serpin B
MLPANTAPEISPEEYATFIADTDEFGFDLFHELATSSENLFFSPLSVATGLALTYAGARGTTAAELEAVLHQTLPPETFHAGMNRLLLDLESRNIAPSDSGGQSVELSLWPANAVWLQTGYPFESGYLATVAASYGARVESLDFAGQPDLALRAINDWASEQTNGRIPQLLGDINPRTRFVLTNALYFLGTWDQRFTEDDTSEGVFHNLAGTEITTPFMHASWSYLDYAEGDGYQLLYLPYAGQQVRMAVLLPAAGRFAEIRDQVSTSWLEEAIGPARKEQVTADLALPRFQLAWGPTSVVDALQALGLAETFTTDADLSGLSGEPGLHVYEVVHGAALEVDERGTRAVAVTSVGGCGNCVLDVEEPRRVTFTVDRPFIPLIVDSSGAVLFAGQVVTPPPDSAG